MPAPKPVSQTIFPWLKSNLGKRCLAPLTGHDAKALLAAVQIIELYAYALTPESLAAFGIIVRHMQRTTQYLAYHAIAHVLDWHDRTRVWDEAGLDHIPSPGICAWEPGGSARR